MVIAVFRFTSLYIPTNNVSEGRVDYNQTDLRPLHDDVRVTIQLNRAGAPKEGPAGTVIGCFKDNTCDIRWDIKVDDVSCPCAFNFSCCKGGVTVSFWSYWDFLSYPGYRGLVRLGNSMNFVHPSGGFRAVTFWVKSEHYLYWHKYFTFNAWSHIMGAAVSNSHHGLLRKSHFSTFYWTSYTLRRVNVKDKYIWTLCMMWILCKAGYFARYLNIKFDVFVPPVHGLLRNGVIPWHWSLSWNFHYSCYPWGILLMSQWKNRLRARSSTSTCSDMATQNVEESFSASFHSAPRWGPWRWCLGSGLVTQATGC